MLIVKLTCSCRATLWSSCSSWFNLTRLDSSCCTYAWLIHHHHHHNQICQCRKQNHRPTPKFTTTLPCEPEFKTRWKIIITIKSFIHWKKYCLKSITEGEEHLTNRLAFFLSRLLRAASRFWASRLSACTVHIESMTPAWISLQVPKKQKKKEIASTLPSVESMQTSSFQLASPTNIVLWTTVTVSCRLCILQALIPLLNPKHI